MFLINHFVKILSLYMTRLKNIFEKIDNSPYFVIAATPLEVPPLKIVINLPRIYKKFPRTCEKLPCKEDLIVISSAVSEILQYKHTNRQKSCYFSIRILMITKFRTLKEKYSFQPQLFGDMFVCLSSLLSFNTFVCSFGHLFDLSHYLKRIEL